MIIKLFSDSDKCLFFLNFISEFIGISIYRVYFEHTEEMALIIDQLILKKLLNLKINNLLVYSKDYFISSINSNHAVSIEKRTI
jgi:hypothetical protein